MRNSLIFKLIGAFLVVIATGSVMISILTSRATQSAFNLYTTRNGQAWAQQLAPGLADYYVSNGSWQGVDAVLQVGSVPASGTGATVVPGSGMGMGRGMGRQLSGGMMMGAMEQRLILADGQGMVVSDTQNELVGKQITPAELKIGAPILVNNKQVGTLMITPLNLSGSGNIAGDFLTSVNQAIISSAGIAGIIALILGAMLSFQITAPLRQLKKAATAIAQGDLSQRVTVRSRDELGEVGHTFNLMAENLANAEMQRQHLVADIAHELRTPLAAIQGTLEGMQDGILPLDEEQVAALHTETILLNRLVGDLRLLSLAEAGQLKLEQQAVSPAEWVQGVAERMKSQASLKRIHIETDIQPDLPDVWIDSDRITQVLNNLIGNALRYTPENGTIRVALTGSPQFIQIAVSDTGPGIESDALSFIFDRFYRADKSRTRSSGGSGLGLAIVKQLVEAHGGKVSAESPVFQDAESGSYGTRISFTLPVA